MALSTTQYGYIIDPMVPFTDGKGNTIKDGFVRVFVAGSSTPVITYRNFDGAANQDLIELDNSGRTKTSVIGSKGITYKVCVYDQLHSQESPILTVDKVSVIGANITAGAGATVVTGLDGLTTKPDGFVDAPVVGTDGYVALDHTLVTDDLDTDAKVTAVENDRYIPLLNDDVNDPDSKMTLGRLWEWVLGKIKSLSTTITAFRTGDVIPVDGPSGTAKMSKDDLLLVTAKATPTDIFNTPIKYFDEGYLRTTGVMDTDSSYHCYVTSKLKVSEGDVIHYKGCGRSNSASVVFYQSNLSYLSYVQQQSENGFADIVVPSGAAYAVISSFANSENEIIFDFAINDGLHLSQSKNVDKIANDFYPITKLTGKMLDYNGAISDAGGNSFVTDYIPCSEGDVFIYGGVAKSSTRSACFYNASRSFVSSVLVNSPNELVEITIPSGVYFVRFASYNGVVGIVEPLVVAKRDSQIGSCLARTKNNERKSTFDFFESVGFLKSTGIDTTQTSYHCLVTNYIPASAGDKFSYKGVGRSLALSVVFYDSQKQVLSYLQYNSPYAYNTLICPADTFYVRFSSFAPSADDVILDVYRGNSQLSEVHSELDGIEPKLTAIVPTESVGWLRSNGAMSGTSGFHCLVTDFIPCKPGDQFVYRGKARSDAVSVVFYDSVRSVVSSAQYNSAAKPVTITIGSGIYFAKFCSFDSSAYGLVFEVYKVGSAEYFDKINSDKDSLDGKKWVVCGDSFSHGDFTSITEPHIHDGIYAGQLPVYSYLIGNRTRCNVHNIAVNGGTLSYVNNGGFTKPSTGLLYTTDFSDADYITLYYGINDMHQNVPIGTINDTEPTTFYGAWNVAMEYLITNYPGAKIGVIITNGCGASGVAYPTATEAICKKWGVPYLDLDGGVGCTTMLRCSTRNPASDALKDLRYAQQKVSETNGHPNELAHKIESTFIEAWLKSL